MLGSPFRCEPAGRDIAQRRGDLFLLLLPCSNGGAGLSERREQGLVEALVTEAAIAIETFDGALCVGFPGGDLLLFDLGLLTPFHESHAVHLRAVVRHPRRS